MVSVFDLCVVDCGAGVGDVQEVHVEAEVEVGVGDVLDVPYLTVEGDLDARILFCMFVIIMLEPSIHADLSRVGYAQPLHPQECCYQAPQRTRKDASIIDIGYTTSRPRQFEFSWC